MSDTVTDKNTPKGNRDLGQGSIPKLLAQLAIPAVVAQVVNLLYNIVDRIYIGHIPEIGANALTGVGLVAIVFVVVSAIIAVMLAKHSVNHLLRSNE